MQINLTGNVGDQNFLADDGDDNAVSHLEANPIRMVSEPSVKSPPVDLSALDEQISKQIYELEDSGYISAEQKQKRQQIFMDKLDQLRQKLEDQGLAPEKITATLEFLDRKHELGQVVYRDEFESDKADTQKNTEQIDSDTVNTKSPGRSASTAQTQSPDQPTTVPNNIQESVNADGPLTSLAERQSELLSELEELDELDSGADADEGDDNYAGDIYLDDEDEYTDDDSFEDDDYSPYWESVKEQRLSQISEDLLAEGFAEDQVDAIVEDLGAKLNSGKLMLVD